MTVTYGIKVPQQRFESSLLIHSAQLFQSGYTSSNDELFHDWLNPPRILNATTLTDQLHSAAADVEHTYYLLSFVIKDHF